MQLEELRNSLSAAGASFPAAVFNFLTFKEASTKGRQSHFHEENSRVSIQVFCLLGTGVVRVVRVSAHRFALHTLVVLLEMEPC